MIATKVARYRSSILQSIVTYFRTLPASIPLPPATPQHWRRGVFMGHHNRLGQYTQIYTFADTRLIQKFVNAIKDEDIKTIRKIIKKGVDVNIDLRFEGGMEKMTALHFAARQGLVFATREILMSKCDLNKATPFDLVTPLHLACQVSDKEAASAIVRDLLMHGANPNLMDHSGRTPLYIAVQLGKLEIARILLRYGSDSSIICQTDEYPDAIHHMSKHLDLMDAERQEMYDPYQGNSPLIQACREHHYDIAKEILKSNCDINYSNSAGNTALHVTAKSESRSTYLDQKMSRFPLTGHPNIIELLLDAGCDMNLMNLQGDTPVKRAIDGIREIFSWSFPIEDKIEHAMIFCDIVSRLVLAGCNLDLRYHDKSVLSVLLLAAPSIKQADSKALMVRYAMTVVHLLAAGADLEAHQLPLLNSFCAISGCLKDALLDAGEKPSPLKHICKVTIRHYMRVPVQKNIRQLCLPRSLKDYVCLKTSI
ncbi:hypothetical protein LSH36_537g02063 [Paralvinella palmiformis]|uniref:SOCS box domain-containing protein n=1 Tax=Paralvinella palmiformis TaxID=53620 RepID=A0AAD9J6X4_9ANNE|nr:hypothetical protein LSH36_537g02063 [Paralvinella palmiformis]